MNVLKTAINWLDGKKTYIGATLLTAGAAISGQLPAIPFLGVIPAIPALAPAVPVLMLVGAVLGGAGWFHKAVKAIQSVNGSASTDAP